MITEADLQQAISECKAQRNPNANTCIKLAAFYILQEHMYGHEESMYSYAPAPYSSNTEFGEVIQGKTDAEVYAVIDELMSALSVLNPPLYEQTLRKLK